MFSAALIAAACMTGSPAPPVPVNTSPPTIDNTTPQDGGAMNAGNGSWTNSPDSFAYAWISGGTQVGSDSSYTAQDSDVGNTITLQVTASNAFGSSAPASSAPTAAVAPLAPVLVEGPQLSDDGAGGGDLTGGPQPGDNLSTDNGVWDTALSDAPASFTYQWSNTVNGPIAGATASTYTVQGSDIGFNLLCTVTAINAGGSTSADTASTPNVV